VGQNYKYLWAGGLLFRKKISRQRITADKFGVGSNVKS